MPKANTKATPVKAITKAATVGVKATTHRASAASKNAGTEHLRNVMRVGVQGMSQEDIERLATQLHTRLMPTPEPKIADSESPKNSVLNDNQEQVRDTLIKLIATVTQLGIRLEPVLSAPSDNVEASSSQVRSLGSSNVSAFLSDVAYNLENTTARIEHLIKRLEV